MGPATTLPARDRGVREALKGWGRRLAKPQRQAGALTADVLAVIRLTAPKPRARRPKPRNGRAGRPARAVSTWPWWPCCPTGGLRRSEAAGAYLGRRAALGRRQRPHHRHPLQDLRRGAGAVVAVTPAAMKALEAIRPAGVGGAVKVFGLSESQIAPAGEGDSKGRRPPRLEFFSGHSGRVGMARRMAQNGAPTHEIEPPGATGSRAAAMVGRYTRGESAGSALRYL